MVLMHGGAVDGWLTLILTLVRDPFHANAKGSHLAGGEGRGDRESTLLLASAIASLPLRHFLLSLMRLLATASRVLISAPKYTLSPLFHALICYQSQQGLLPWHFNP